MKIFITPPNTKLELNELGDGFYCLAQFYKSNEKYREYTKKMKSEGKFIILDSGIGNEGEVIQKEELFELTRDIRPNEVIPTDVLFNKDETIENTKWFIDKMKEYKEEMEGIDVFACPQGDTFEDWVKCYDYFLKVPEVKTIGMSKKAIPHVYYGEEMDRKDQGIAFARKYVTRFLRERNLIQKPLHYLGMGNITEFRDYRDIPLARSTDSCYAVLAGIKGVNFKERINNGMEIPRIPTPADYFDMEVENEDIILSNIEMLRYCTNPNNKY